MKSRVLMAALVVTLLMGTRVYANDCSPCEPVCDPCGNSDGCLKSVDLFAGLKSLVAHRSPCSEAECGPCDGVVACSPCDEVACDPCGECGDLGCNTDCSIKFSFGKRLKGLFARKGCDPCGPCDIGPCDDTDTCGPCDDLSNPCDDTGCKRVFTLKKLFKGFSIGGRCDIGCDDPCGAACDLGNCDPCGDVGDCNPCDDAGCNSHLKLGLLLDKPRRGLKKLFDGISFGGCDTGCNPCDAVSCDPCDNICASPATSKLPEAAK